MRTLYKLYWHATYNCAQPLDMRSGEMLIRAQDSMSLCGIFWQHITNYVNTLHLESVKMECVEVWPERLLRVDETVYE
ncbi:MAG TPA: hypothetical protein VGC91_08030 [Pyrinomonadaceae bacterium]|jgi:hypothetical protein